MTRIVNEVKEAVLAKMGTVDTVKKTTNKVEVGKKTKKIKS